MTFKSSRSGRKLEATSGCDVLLGLNKRAVALSRDMFEVRWNTMYKVTQNICSPMMVCFLVANLGCEESEILS